MTKLVLAVFAGILCLVHMSYGQPIIHSESIATIAMLSTPVITPSRTSSAMPSPSVSPSAMPSPSVSPSAMPSPSMSPLPSPTNSNFVFKKKNGDVCAHVSSTINLSINYKRNTTGKNATTTIPVNHLTPEVDSSSDCDDTEINMTISFHNDTEYRHLITFEFSRGKKDSKSYELKSISADLDVGDENLFPDFDTNITDIVNGTTTEKDGIYNVDKEMSYRCKSSRKYSMKTQPDLGKNGLTVELSNFQAQAFNFKNSTAGNFDKSKSCTRDQKSSKVVPIAVGAALAGLVVVVLIAYLIGRFRSRKQNSYEALS